MTFSLAHFSDPHLGPLPKGAVLQDFAFKKIIGAASWHMNRKKHHLPQIADALRADILAANPDHVAFTGDLVNISAAAEFDQGLKWLNGFGSSDFVSFTPGNHDAYVKLPLAKGLGKFSTYMTNEIAKDESLPFIRLRRNVALIGIHAACPQLLLGAGGTVGTDQLQKLDTNLQSLRERGFYRLVMIHHPPAPGMTSNIRSLSDASALEAVLKKQGAELVIHGHNHQRNFNEIVSDTTRIPVLGVPSASMAAGSNHPPAAWNRYDIERYKGTWKTHVQIRNWNAEANSFSDGDSFNLEGAS